MSFKIIVARTKIYLKSILGMEHSPKANVFDVAAYILEKMPREMTTWKLQKLVYYCQAWHLVWEDKPLFPERIEAWFAGPVVPELYYAHKGKYQISRADLKKGNSLNLADNEKESIDVVIKDFGKHTGFELSQMTHNEAPWKLARGGCAPNEVCTSEITLESMGEYYSSL